MGAWAASVCAAAVRGGPAGGTNSSGALAPSALHGGEERCESTFTGTCSDRYAQTCTLVDRCPVHIDQHATQCTLPLGRKGLVLCSQIEMPQTQDANTRQSTAVLGARLRTWLERPCQCSLQRTRSWHRQGSGWPTPRRMRYQAWFRGRTPNPWLTLQHRLIRKQEKGRRRKPQRCRGTRCRRRRRPGGAPTSPPGRAAALENCLVPLHRCRSSATSNR